MAKNNNLHKAKRAKKDEFYTRYQDIANEMEHYRQHFKGKIVYCNCDDPSLSEFWRYFHNNFAFLGLKKLISTHYKENNNLSYSMEYEGGDDFNINAGKITEIVGNKATVAFEEVFYKAGDFRSEDCIKLLKQSDIVVTNPPFSLFREYIAQLLEYEKKFVIIGNQNAITYKEVFPLLKNNKIWLGMGFKGNVGFFKSAYEDIATASQHKDGYIRVSGVVWFTNLDIQKRHGGLWHLNGKFDKTQAHCYYEGNEDKYPKYDNYDAINVDKTSMIPIDYSGVMGVPITFMDKFNPVEFEIIGLSSKQNAGTVKRTHPDEYYNGYTRGKVVTRVESNMPLLKTNISGGTKCSKDGCYDVYQLYWRIFIKNRNPIAKKDNK